MSDSPVSRLDPSISLDAGKGVTPSILAGNPADTIGSLMPLVAKQQAGQIIAGSPDQATAIASLRANPTTAAWAPELINQYAQTGQIMANIDTTRQGQFNEALKGFLGSLGPTLKDPSLIPQVTNSYLAGLPPEIRKTVEPSVQGYLRGAKDVLATGSQTGWNNYVLGTMGGLGMDPSHLEAMFGSQGLTSVGDKLVPTVTVQPVYGGGITANGPSVGIGLPPARVTLSTGAVTPYGAVSGGGGFPGPNGLTPTPSSTSSDLPPNIQLDQTGHIVGANGLTGPISGPPGNTSSQPQNPAPGGPSPTTNSGAKAYDGTPLFTPVQGMGAPKLDAGGQVISLPGETGAERPTEVAQDDQIAKDYSGKYTDQFQNAQTSAQSLQSVLALYKQLGANKGLYSTGVGSDFKSQLQALANSFESYTGTPLSFKQSDVGSEEFFKKLSIQLGATFARDVTRGPEAASTIENLSKAIPSIENTPFGGTLIAEDAMNKLQRSMDQYKFMGEYFDHYKTYNKVFDAFNAQHPIEQYEKPLLDKYGIGPDGFKDKASVQNLINQGLLNVSEANKLWSQQEKGK